jgi:hypothetical protein
MANNAREILSRSITFWCLVVLTLSFVFFLDYSERFNSCLAIYFIEASVALICASMFADWWRVKGSASSVYKWITLLLFAVAFNDGLQAYARYRFLYYPDTYTAFLNSTLWEYRAIPKMISMLYLLAFAVWQRFGKGSTYSNGIRKDMANGFETLNARIVAGELRFEGHAHEGLVIGAKLILKAEAEDKPS